MELFTFLITFAIMLFIIIVLDLKYNMLRDESTLENKIPYSFSRVQLSWWTVIILSSLIAILITKCHIPTFDKSILVLLGITAGTLAAARITDISDQKKSAAKTPPADGTAPNPAISQNSPSENFFLDILSDNNGVSIHRFQTVVFNLIFGCWFIYSVIHNLQNDPCMAALIPKDCASHSWDCIMPVITDNNLILLGLSSGTYVALKATENKI